MILRMAHPGDPAIGGVEKQLVFQPRVLGLESGGLDGEIRNLFFEDLYALTLPVAESALSCSG